jgi:hypothetical protein
MNKNPTAALYRYLTALERFRLVAAAEARGDVAESQRLCQTAPRLALTAMDFVPFEKAFDELAVLVYCEALAAAADYLEVLRSADDAEWCGAPEDDAGERAVEMRPADTRRATRLRRLALALGFELKSQVEGWKQFCARLNLAPFETWDQLPGYHRLQRALRRTERAAFSPEGMLRYVNRHVLRGEPGLKTPPFLPESMASQVQEMFQLLATGYGGKQAIMTT